MANLRRTMPPADGITVRRKSRALFQQHRPSKATSGMNHIDRVGQISIGASGFLFHATVYEEGPSNLPRAGPRPFELTIRKCLLGRAQQLRTVVQIIETSFRWASVSPSMYRWVV